jgi:hypothetical protein
MDLYFQMPAFVFSPTEVDSRPDPDEWCGFAASVFMAHAAVNPDNPPPGGSTSGEPRGGDVDDSVATGGD